MSKSPIIVALDHEDADSAIALARQLDARQCQLKIGKGLFTRSGPAIVETLMTMGFAVFLDLKFHDIPNTVALACKAAADLGVWMINVHCSGGLRMMQAAKNALAGRHNPPLLIGVTVLTSLAEEDLRQIGIDESPREMAGRLALLARRAGLDGVVCSAQEAPLLRAQCGGEFLLVTPGIRLQSFDDDQRRITTPSEAIRNGADYLVIGRPVTASNDPAGILAATLADLKHAQH